MNSSLPFSAFKVLCILCITLASTISANEKKNLLFICVDDFKTVGGSYGGQAITPNMDALAKSGIQFNNHYVQYPVCGPSRNAMLHGIRPDTTAIDSINMAEGKKMKKYGMKNTYDWKVGKKYPTFMELARDNGYKTAVFGKVAHGNSAYMKPTIPFKKTGEWQCWVDRTEKDEKGVYRPAYEIFNGDESKHSDIRGLNATLDALDQLKEEPFCIAVGFWKPHFPFVTPKRMWDMYEEIDLTPVAPQQINKTAGQYIYGGGGQEFFSYGDEDGELYSYNNMPNNKEIYNLTRAYYATVSYTDEHIGKLLNKLEELGIRENTHIILWSDHGLHLGDQGHWCKNSQFEVNFNSPLIIDIAGKNPSFKTDQIVETVDLYPTICDLFNIEKPEYLEGDSLMPILQGDKILKTGPAYSQCDRGYSAFSVRTERFRYTEWRNPKKLHNLGKIELYDHKNDPLETTNIAENPEYLNTIKNIRKLLPDGFKRLREAGITGNEEINFNGWQPVSQYN